MGYRVSADLQRRPLKPLQVSGMRLDAVVVGSLVDAYKEARMWMLLTPCWAQLDTLFCGKRLACGAVPHRTRNLEFCAPVCGAPAMESREACLNSQALRSSSSHGLEQSIISHNASGLLVSLAPMGSHVEVLQVRCSSVQALVRLGLLFFVHRCWEGPAQCHGTVRAVADRDCPAGGNAMSNEIPSRTAPTVA